jgi:uncharacterized membrane protein
MRGFTVSPNFTIFVIFFGAALVEAVRHGDWVMALVFVVLGALFLRVKEPTLA